jgi:hypothetical protein
MTTLPQFSPVHDTIPKGLNNVAKGYNKTKDTNTCFIYLGLNPNVKVAYSKHQWDAELFKVSLKDLEQVVHIMFV